MEWGKEVLILARAVFVEEPDGQTPGKQHLLTNLLRQFE
jgi:hypothetical protein